MTKRLIYHLDQKNLSKRKKAEIQAFKDLPSYQELMSRPYFACLKKKISGELKNYHFKNKKILEIGAGTSQFLKLFENENQVVALDICADLLKQNKTKAKLVVGDAENLPFADHCFDFVYVTGILHHLEDQKKALLGIKRVLEKDGQVFISEPTRLSLNLPYYLLRRLMIHLMGEKKYLDSTGCGTPEESFIDERAVKEVFDQNWQVETRKILPVRMPPLGFWEKLWPSKLNEFLEKTPLLKNLGTIVFLKIRKKSGQDLGFGINYEKDILKKTVLELSRKYKIKSAMEYPKTFLLGEEKILNFQEKQKKPDLVWNFCAYEQAPDIYEFAKNMADLTGKYVLVITQNYFNPGVLIHKLFHMVTGKKWDHGNLGKMSGLSVKQVFLKLNNWKLKEWGAFDVPWFILDVYETGRYIRNLPFFKSKNAKISESRFESWPKWLRFFLAHHHYLLMEKTV